MSSFVRVLVLTVVGCLFLAVIGLGLLLADFKPDEYRRSLEAAMSRSLGRECRIRGKIETAFFPSFTLRASDVLVQDAGPFGDGPFCTVRELGFAIPLSALMGKEIVVEELYLENAVVHLKSDAEGQGNWQYGFGGEKAASDTPAQKADSGVRMQPARILCSDLRVVYRDALDDSAYSVVFNALELQGMGENKEIPFELAAELQDHNSPRRVHVDLAGFSRFSWSEGLSLMLSSMRVTARGFSEEDKTINAAGQVSWSFTKGRMHFEDFSGHFGTDAFRGNASFTRASDGLPASLTGYVHIEKLDLDALAGGISAPAPARDAGIVRGAPNLVRPTVHGGSQGRPPALSIPGMAGAASSAAAPGAAGKGGENGHDCLPDPAQLNLDFTLSAGTLVAKGLPFKRGRLTVNSPEEQVLLQYSADLYGGAVAGQAEVDVLCKDVALHASASVSNGSMEEFTADLEHEWSATGTFDASVEISGAGSSTSGLLNSLQGKFAAQAKDGAIHHFALIPPDLPQVNAPPPILPYDRMGASAKITEGVATTKDIVFTASMLTGRGGGTLRLAQGQVDVGIDFFPDGKRPSVPVYIRGPYNALSSGVDMRLFRRNVREISESLPEHSGETLFKQF